MSSATAASAHLTLTNPPARHPADDLKQGPCGVGAIDSRTTDPAKITTYMAGETITVEWTEVVDHDPSHYRIAFSYEGDDFVDPTGFDDQETVFPELMDGILDAEAGSGHQYSVQVTLPDEPCDLCSIQVIQVMHDKPPWGPEGGDDIYYQCADIVILTDPDGPDPMDPPVTGDGGAPIDMAAGGTFSSGGAFGTGGTATDPGIGGTPADFGTGGTVSDPMATGGASAAPAESSSNRESGGVQPACSMNPASRQSSPWLLVFLTGALWGSARRRGTRLDRKRTPS